VVLISRFVFGPVYSRRLGRSLGVNNIPYKTCSYSCIYCQLGRTTNYGVVRRCFYSWTDVIKDITDFLRVFKDDVDYHRKPHPLGRGGGQETFSRILSPERVELLNIPEPPPKAYGDPITWLLNTVSVHPLRYEYAVNVLGDVYSNPDEVIEKLVREGLIVEVQYLSSKYLIKSFKSCITK